MKINYNASAMVAHRSLTQSDKALSNSLERLSSGYKINHAKDNASGLAMAKRMNAQIRSLEVANQNSNDGISAIQIAEGALSEITEMIQRMNELAVKASNGTMTDEDRKNIDAEVQQLKDEIERVSKTTMYNGEVLLDGSFDLKGYTDDINVKVVTYSDDVRAGGDYKITLNASLDDDGNIAPGYSCSLDGADFPAGCTTKIKGDSLIVTDDRNFTIEYQIKDDVSNTIESNITGIGAMGLQIGTNEGQMLDVRIPTISLKALSLEKGDVLTEENAKNFIDSVKDALTYVNKARSILGAYTNRLEYTTKTIDVSDENMTAAYSRIMDTDMSKEMTEYSSNQVLVQAGTSMLAQANERPSQILQLLQ